MNKRALRLAASLIFGLIVRAAVADPLDDILQIQALSAYRGGDFELAVKIWFPLAKNGNAQARYQLGGMYQNGDGLPQNYTEALKWYLLAAQQGHSLAQAYLGQMHLSGEGVPKDIRRAYMWYSISTTSSAFAVSARSHAHKQMSPEQLAEARVMAEVCKKSSYQNCGLGNSKNLSSPTRITSNSIAMKRGDSGTYRVPVHINNAIILDFLVDSGASDVSVPIDVFSTLRRAGTIKDTDLTGQQTYILADGSKSQSPTFTIRSLKVGNTVVENVRGSVASSQGTLLLGQSFLERFKSWSIDNKTHRLVLDPH